MVGVPMSTTKDLSARAGVPGEACRDKPPWVLCSERELFVATELTHFMSQ